MPGHMMTGWKCLMQAEESCSLSNHEQLRGDGMQSFFDYIVIGLSFHVRCLNYKPGFTTETSTVKTK